MYQIIDDLVVATQTIKQGTQLFYDYHYIEDWELTNPDILWDENRQNPLLITCEFKFIRHHDDPNICIRGEGIIDILQDIHPGEELTHDYGELYRQYLEYRSLKAS
ncbi:SET domain-containing protein-lysine N-methyltransferase [Pleionea sp. CnH1-48]|uniref:SET domain-containing protein-lysine N-methyltransferase n=1 Tax=Pleionea sp. CnH1-48 TaxID=2954494 RepID=UPI002096AD9C|nr:SET domain-containing protein [Pleionea sp. CnH1-48]MCO7225339.1 SET domain-containing protein [Pleionea sp. CnH1-48]